MKNFRFIILATIFFQSSELLEAATELDTQYELLAIHGQDVHKICKRMHLCNVSYNDGPVLGCGDLSELDHEPGSIQAHSPFSEVGSIDTKNDILAHIINFLSHKGMMQLLDQVNELLETNNKTILFTLGKNVAVIGEHQLAQLKLLKDADQPLLTNAIHVVLNLKALEESWVYTIQGLRNLEIKPNIAHDCFLLNPDQQEPFMVLAHEFLHIIQDLKLEKAGATSQSEIYPYLDECSIDGLDIENIRKTMSLLWTQSTEVGVIVGLPSYENRITELSLRESMGLPFRVFHSGGIGDVPTEGLYTFCDTLPMINKTSITSLPALVSYAEMKSIQRLMNWLDGKTETPMTDSSKPTPMVSSSEGGTSGRNSALADTLKDWDPEGPAVHGGENDIK